MGVVGDFGPYEDITCFACGGQAHSYWSGDVVVGVCRQCVTKVCTALIADAWLEGKYCRNQVGDAADKIEREVVSSLRKALLCRMSSHLLKALFPTKTMFPSIQDEFDEDDLVDRLPGEEE